jgi:hypothetical protein
MSNATELLRRARQVFGNCRGDDAEDLFDEICAFLDAEPEAEPVAWQSLTDEEISDVLNVDPQWFMDGLNWKALDLLEYARDIERALREKNSKSFEPVAWMFQHEDTGLIDFVDTQQVEWGFEKNNPRWQKFGPVFLHPPKPAEPAARKKND